MRRQLSPPSKLLVPPGPQAFPQRHFLGESTVIVNHYSGIEKAIPAIPSLPGFKTSAGMFLPFACLGWWSRDGPSHGSGRITTFYAVSMLTRNTLLT
jgi:hypothetical protein